MTSAKNARPSMRAAAMIIVVLIVPPASGWRAVPSTALAAILMFVAYNMGDWKEFWHMQHFSLNYRMILVSTFVLTVAIDLSTAVEVGLLLSCFLFITRVSSLTHLEPIASGDPDVEIFELHGSLFFGSISKVEELLKPNRSMAKVMILDLTHLLNLDSTGLEALEEMHDLMAKHGGTLVLCGATQQPSSILHRSGFADKIGKDHILPTLAEARAFKTISVTAV